jgi:hypothetical protein
MSAEPARYVAPKLRAVEHSGDGNAPRFVLIGVPKSESAEAWERRVVNGKRRKDDPQ